MKLLILTAATTMLWSAIINAAVGNWPAVIATASALTFLIAWAFERARPRCIHVHETTVMVPEPMDERELANRLVDAMRGAR